MWQAQGTLHAACRLLFNQLTRIGFWIHAGFDAPFWLILLPGDYTVHASPCQPIVLTGIFRIMSYYQYHVFFCTNVRTDGRACCADHNAQAMRDYLKKKVKQAGLSGEGRVRINTAGCLDRCELGPVIAIYPEDTWYTYVDQEDLDEILESHLKNGKRVERLLIS